jgi:tripeptidyl-peptidase-2
LIQVDRAFEHHIEWQTSTGQKIPIEVSVLSPPGARGILLREPAQTDRIFEGTIALKPRFPKDADRKLLLDYQLPIRLVPSADWIEIGQHLLLFQDGDHIPITVDPRNLDPGAHRAEVLGFDDAHPERGPLFRIPICVTKPHRCERGVWTGMLTSDTAAVNHHFIAVPSGARDVSVRLRRKGGSGNRIFQLHAVQLVPGESYEAHEWQKAIALAPDELFEASLPIVPGRTLEFCIAQYWNSPGATDLELTLRFHGLAVEESEITLPSDGSPVSIGIRSEVSVERCEPSAKLTAWEEILTPCKYEFQLLTAQRDHLWDEIRPWRLLLQYEFEQSDRQEISLRCPEFLHLLYDSPVDSFRILVLNDQHERVKMEDTEPESFSVEPGKYTVQVELRQTDRNLLEQFTALPLAVRRPLPSSIDLPIDSSAADSLREADAFNDLPMELEPGEQTIIFMKAPADAKIPDAAKTGDRFIGQLYVTRSRTSGIPISHPLKISAGEESRTADPAEEKTTKPFDLQQAQRQFWLTSLKSLTWPDDQKSIDQLVRLVLEQDPQNREVRVSKLHLLDNDDREERLPEIVAAANEVIKLVDSEKLRSWSGARHASQSAEEKKSVQEHEREKQDLVDALYRKGRALAYMELPEVVKDHPIADQKTLDEEFEQNYLQLQSWVDMELQDYFLLKIRRDRRRGDFGQAMKLLNRWIGKGSRKKLYAEKQQAIYESLGWNIWSRNAEHWLLRRFPEQSPAL